MVIHIRFKHRLSHRVSKWAHIISVVLAPVEGIEEPRACFLVGLPDGTFQHWLIYSTDFDYEFRQTPVSP